MADVPPHVERMIVEEQQLASRMDALRMFMEGGPIYDSLSDRQRELMGIQYGAMVLYHNALVERVALEQQ